MENKIKILEKKLNKIKIFDKIYFFIQINYLVF